MLPCRPTLFNLFSGVDCGKAGSSAVCNRGRGGNPLVGPHGLLIDIANIIAYIAGAAAIILILIGAFKLVTSGSDTSKGGRVDDDVVEARRSIVNALVGLVIIVLAKTLIVYVIGKL